MAVLFNKRDPIYLQVVQNLKQKIVSGALQPGQEVPSRRELANQLKINPNTVQRAYKEMEDEGLLYTEGNLPSRITENKDVLRTLKQSMIQQAVDEFVSAITSIHVSPEEVLQLVKEKLTKPTNKGGQPNA
ncbi:GntR family transcriptional regulator [Aerococcus urinaeequi]|uniref:GntR family transcriptional regulator n=1 Tax=Aerococcus urinaeequi TaxID=51665 RepID=UPI003B3BCD10